MQKILIAGGTGFLGKHLIPFLAAKGYTLHVLTRNKNTSLPQATVYAWDVEKGYIDARAFEGVDTVINLTGAGIGDKRWTAKRKQELLNSRTQPLALLYRYITERDLPVRTVISSSAVGYYGAVTTDQVFTEDATGGHDFLGNLCAQWESAARQFEASGRRVVILRKGVIMANNGPFYEKMASVARWGINPAVGSGKQYVPWIGASDLLRCYDFILQHEAIAGVFNAVSGAPVTMNTMAKAFLHHFGYSKWTPNVPAFLAKLIFGEMANMLLEGSKVSEQKIRDAGFTFQVNDIETSLR